MQRGIDRPLRQIEESSTSLAQRFDHGVPVGGTLCKDRQQKQIQMSFKCFTRHADDHIPSIARCQVFLDVESMAMTEWITVHGVIVQGYRVASGPSVDYPYGALDRQRPIFKARGLDLNEYFNGSLNIDIRPREFVMEKPQFTFRKVEWTDLHPPEHFSFSRCKVMFRNVEYDGWVYYPHPETKKRNFQNPSLLEVIAMHIPEIQYGDEVDVSLNSGEISVK